MMKKRLKHTFMYVSCPSYTLPYMCVCMLGVDNNISDIHPDMETDQ